MSETFTLAGLPKIEASKPLIGIKRYLVDLSISEGEMYFLNQFRSLINPDMAERLSSRMHNNSSVSGSNLFGQERPVSAYFTVIDGKLIIEWGEIDPYGQAKLHDYLNRSVGYAERIRRGGIVRSGHIANITLPGLNAKIGVALLDSLSSGNLIGENSPEYTIAATLLKNQILPITSEGYPV